MKYLTVLVVVLTGFVSMSCGKDSSDVSSTQALVREGPVLLYNGEGAASADVTALAGILNAHDVSYELIDENELNAMAADDLLHFGTIVWPGGLAGTGTKALSKDARIAVRRAVVEFGVSYVGFCAGAFMAMNAPPVGDNAAVYGFGIVPYDGILPEYEPNGVHQHDHPQTVVVNLPGGKTQDVAWYGGPFFPTANEVLARYKDGTPAMMQTYSGMGFVVLSGPHPESPPAWVSTTDTDGTVIDRELAWSLINAGLTRTRLQTL